MRSAIGIVIWTVGRQPICEASTRPTDHPTSEHSHVKGCDILEKSMEFSDSMDSHGIDEPADSKKFMEFIDFVGFMIVSLGARKYNDRS